MTARQYHCDICDYVYDPALGCPEEGIAPGTPWEEIAEDWVCPECGAPKNLFSESLESE
ncbi:rubredoxin [Aestuariirhabdus sp. Z084]|uniref:rubredoxin n=1 Tax=Aestuariirhabdus haliotis TaxID=2918751 RepID=UPI00201B37F1|nr:rubredoxin [Aestuariirhabdus haliotis]MCL6415311.1 rubredoxin [Aestuariirhabdus haliotis]MCL6419571.1 rubredoxin [Aestuariirhabdus haliotis]